MKRRDIMNLGVGLIVGGLAGYFGGRYVALNEFSQYVASIKSSLTQASTQTTTTPPTTTTAISREQEANVKGNEIQSGQPGTKKL